MILVSACLLGVKSRYDGTDNLNERVIQFLRDKGECAIPVCPEQLGGLSTPRNPTTLRGGGEAVLDGSGKAIMEEVGDVTENFIRGAEEVLKLAKLFNVDQAILKSGSPSCGTGKALDSSTGRKDSKGVTAALLERNGIDVVSEEEI